ncbi:MAG: hypothetical protein ACTSWD_11690 [Candidatus Heimdallarchaeota archaeon]
MSIAKFKEKFIVINRKHLDENCKDFDVEKLFEILGRLDLPEHEYIVCNQDEFYASKVLAAILRGEDFKEADKICRRNGAKNYRGR